MRHEAQNLLPLGNIIIGNEGKDKTGWRDPVNWFMATVTNESGIVLTAVMTPPWNLTLYATDNIIIDEAIDTLIAGIKETKANDPAFSLPGIITTRELGERTANKYSEAMGVKYRVDKDMRLYELTEVNTDIPLTGVMRRAKESDMSFHPFWVEGFSFDCFGHNSYPKVSPEDYLYQITKRKLFILEDAGMPVSMAMINREMRSICGISQVYTPPYFRGKGYASSIVAQLSSLILKEGFTKCVLYTDLSNPTSNSIYQKIGYRPVADSLEIKFEG